MKCDEYNEGRLHYIVRELAKKSRSKQGIPLKIDSIVLKQADNNGCALFAGENEAVPTTTNLESPVDVLLAFGANLGDPRSQILHAWQLVSQVPGIAGMRLSPLYATEPVGGPKNQPNYLNCAGLISTTLSPGQLLQKIQEIESKLGRVRTEHWGPRSIDIDIVLFGALVVHTDTLTIPHPRMQERSFVLDPAGDVAADMIHPTLGKNVAELRRMLRENR